MKTEIPIFFSADDNYVPYLATALNSAVRNSSKYRNYRAIVLHRGVNAKSIKRIKSLAAEHFKIDFVEMDKGLEDITDRLSNRLRYDIFTLTIYFRLFIPSMFPQYDKGIYIDSDVVLTGDIAELYDIDIGDNYIGACRDISISGSAPLMDYTISVVGMNKGDYINSGVLLMNMKSLRDKKFDEHFMNLLREYHFDSVAPDQDYINAICREKIHYLPPVWNTMPNGSGEKTDVPKLVHFNLYSKPWRRSGIQYEEEFWRYAESSGFIEEIKEEREKTHGESSDEDEMALGILIERALSIMKNKVTLKIIGDSGVRVML